MPLRISMRDLGWLKRQNTLLDHEKVQLIHAQQETISQEPMKFFFNVNLDKDYKQFPDRRRRATIFCTETLTIQIIEIEASIDTGGAIHVQS